MSKKWTIAVAASAALVAGAIPLSVRYFTQRPPTIQGAVITREPDPAKELPVADVQITAIGTQNIRGTKSDGSGYFKVQLPWNIRPNQRVTLRLRHPDYETMDLVATGGSRLYVARLSPIVRLPAPSPTSMPIKIAQVVVDYSMTTTTNVNVGSAVRSFEAVNEGNVPCNGHGPCSPDGKWRASEGSTTIDAGVGNQFENARVSCIAGPCPFTKIEDGLKNGSRMLQVSALDWSSTATFLLEAEVYKQVRSNLLRHSYPLIFERALTFTLPPSADGVSIEAEVNGAMIVFPLGPALYLSWANCQMAVNQDQTRVYRCELKPEYQFDTSHR